MLTQNCFSMSNTVIRITTDGTVVTYDPNGVRIPELCGDLTMLHKLLKINKMKADMKHKLPSSTRVRNAEFYFIREDTGELLPVPASHLTRFVEHIDKNDVDTFVEELIMNSLNH